MMPKAELSTSLDQSLPKKSHGFLQDGAGDNSSKRLCGTILMGLGIFMGISLFILGLNNPDGTYTSSFRVMRDFIIAGTSLLGLGLVENINKIFDKSK